MVLSVIISSDENHMQERSPVRARIGKMLIISRRKRSQKQNLKCSINERHMFFLIDQWEPQCFCAVVVATKSLGHSF